MPNSPPSVNRVEAFQYTAAESTSARNCFACASFFILNVRVVDGVPAAVDQINFYGSGHSDSIITKNEAHAKQFLAEVDSAAVYWNASTRFTDGGEFGMGAEIGNSTQKLHARGPIGLRELCTIKYVVTGDGHVRA